MTNIINEVPLTRMFNSPNSVHILADINHEIHHNAQPTTCRNCGEEIPLTYSNMTFRGFISDYFYDLKCPHCGKHYLVTTACVYDKIVFITSCWEYFSPQELFKIVADYLKLPADTEEELTDDLVLRASSYVRQHALYEIIENNWVTPIESRAIRYALAHQVTYQVGHIVNAFWSDGVKAGCFSPTEISLFHLRSIPHINYILTI